MAELINLQEADNYLRMAEEDLRNFRRNVVEARTRNIGSIWSNQQIDDLEYLFDGILAVHKAIIQVLYNNRDGRGTVHQPTAQRR